MLLFIVLNFNYSFKMNYLFMIFILMVNVIIIIYDFESMYYWLTSEMVYLLKHSNTIQ